MELSAFDALRGTGASSLSSITVTRIRQAFDNFRMQWSSMITVAVI